MNDTDIAALEPEYEPRKPDEYQEHYIDDFRMQVSEVASNLRSVASHYELNGRYKALALTKLEEASMFITKAITHNDL
jgi:uncharacterized protein (DUF433 family)